MTEPPHAPRNWPLEEDIARAALAIHAVDCDVVACDELETTGRYAMWGFAVMYALRNPNASNLEIAYVARDWRATEVRRPRPGSSAD